MKNSYFDKFCMYPATLRRRMQINTRQTEGSPLGVLVPLFEGEQVTDSINGMYYVATGTSADSWISYLKTTVDNTPTASDDVLMAQETQEGSGKFIWVKRNIAELKQKLSLAIPNTIVGNFPSFKDTNGGLQDSGKKASDFAPSNHNHDTSYASIQAVQAVSDYATGHAGDGDVHTSSAEKAAWNSKAAGDHNHNSSYASVQAVQTLSDFTTEQLALKASSNHNHDAAYASNQAVQAVSDYATGHAGTADVHSSASEKAAWNSKAAGNHNHDTAYASVQAVQAVSDYATTHAGTPDVHTSPAEKAAWNSKAAGNHNHDAAYASVQAVQTLSDFTTEQLALKAGSFTVQTGQITYMDENANPQTITVVTGITFS